MRKTADKSRKKTVVFIVGPTATGKTAVAAGLVKRISGEVVSCDSMQVYKGMPILSQIPSASARKAVRHHLVSFISPSREYSVASFRRSAVSAIKAILAKGKVPIVAGGTGLYAKALIDGLFPSPKADRGFRSRMEAFASRYGSARLHSRLKKIDPASASLIHPNDKRRIIRALELYNSTGRTMTELKSGTRGLKDIYDIKIFGIKASRENIYSAIDKRVEKMLRSGVVREVKRLKNKKLSRTSSAAIGFKEISAYLEGGMRLEEAVALMKMNTRRFAKRQMTWFGADKRIVWLDIGRLGLKGVVDRIAGKVA